MKKVYAFNLMLLAVAIGFCGGVWFNSYFSERNERELEMERQEDRADIALRALHDLRENPRHTEPFLEAELDDAIVSLGDLVAKIPPPERNNTALLMLAKTRDYRAKYPHKSTQPGQDQEIAAPFKLLDEKH